MDFVENVLIYIEFFWAEFALETNKHHDMA